MFEVSSSGFQGTRSQDGKSRDFIVLMKRHSDVAMNVGPATEGSVIHNAFITGPSNFSGSLLNDARAVKKTKTLTFLHILTWFKK